MAATEAERAARSGEKVDGFYDLGPERTAFEAGLDRCELLGADRMPGQPACALALLCQAPRSSRRSTRWTRPKDRATELGGAPRLCRTGRRVPAAVRRCGVARWRSPSRASACWSRGRARDRAGSRCEAFIAEGAEVHAADVDAAGLESLAARRASPAGGQEARATGAALRTHVLDVHGRVECADRTAIGPGRCRRPRGRRHGRTQGPRRWRR